MIDRYAQAQRPGSNHQGPVKYTTISVTDGYSLIYSFWSDAVSRQAGLILSIDETKAKRERDRWEQEKEAEKRREQEEEDARGYDGL